MSLTNCILSQVSNQKLKEILEASLYSSGGSQEIGEIRSLDQSFASQQPNNGDTVFDHIIGQRLDQAIEAALLSFE